MFMDDVKNRIKFADEHFSFMYAKLLKLILINKTPKI